MVESLRRGLLGLSLLALTSGLAGPVQAAQAPSAPAPVMAVRTPKGPLKAALLALGRQTGVQIVFASRAVEGRQAPALDGAFSVDEALARLLAGSDLEARRAGPGVLVIRPRGGLAPASAEGAAAPDLFASLSADPVAAAAPAAAATGDATMLSEVVVGSHIRGVKDSASPVVVLSRQDIDRAGYGGLAEALSALPQASGGTASEDSVATGADLNGTNMMRGAGVDLRGLGADATLVLFNGKRMAGAGVYGDFSDISSIPFAAVGGVDVLLDGASATYGSDAVGGVVNIRLRTDLDGGETRASGGTATQGGYSRYLVSQALGKTWSGGHVLAAYEYTRNDALRGADRPYAGNADLTALGGADRRSVTLSAPGNILRLNAAGVYVSTYAIPAGQDGTGLTPGDFVFGTVNRFNQKGAYDILPKSTRHSAVLSVGQALGPVELSGDLRYARRRIDARNSAPGTTLVLTAANPFYVSPTGQASERVTYSFQNERGGVDNAGVSESLGASLEAKAAIGAGWFAALSGTYAQELGRSDGSGLLNSTNLNEAAGLSPDTPLTAFSPARDGYFNPYIGQGSNPAKVLDFVLSGWDVSKSRGEHRSINLGLDGPLLRLPGGSLRLAVGGQLRREELRTGGARFLTGYVQTAKVPRAFSRDVKAVYAELNAPLVGPDNAVAFVHRLELSLAGRIEDYDDVGATRNPKIGLIWAPSRSLAFKATYGTSFRAPALPELFLPYTVSPVAITHDGGQFPTLVYQGGNPDLKPETARSWTAGLTLTPAAVPRLTVELSAYRTVFKDRVGAPVVLTQALTSAQYAPFVTLVHPATNPADRARVLAVIADPNASGTSAYAVDTYGAIIDARNVNTGSLEVQGLDAQLAYATTLAGDPLSFNANLSWMTHYKRRLTPTSARTELAGAAGYPADLRARVSASWSHGPATVTTAVSHVGDTRAETGRRVHPWTTLDLQGRWRGEILGAQGLSLTLNVQNLLDSDPPFYDNPLAIGYDPVNADPLGRMVSLQLTKAW